tara:strand:- start:447 stop:1358 length:912 start_codon:yes stop_codon:yes gene_type:complete
MLQLVKDKITGLYQTQQVSQTQNPVIDTSGYEAYTNAKKTTLATGTGATTDLGQQTESILQRDTGGQLTYDPASQSFKRTGEETKKLNFGQLPTTTDTSATPDSKQSDPIAVAQRIAQMTPMQQSMGELPDFASMYEATQPSMKDQLFGAALDAGKDFAVRYATQKVLGKTFAGQLASSQVGMGATGLNMAALANPYTLAAAALFTKPGQKIAKKAVKIVKKFTSKATRAIGKIFSDIRLKTNIEFIGKSPSNINIYQFSYIGSPIKYVGVMAHEVPWASEKHESGYLMVDYNKVDVEFRRLN